MPHQAFHESHDLVLREERGLDVELSELRLAVGAQILVAETAHDLVVTIEARDHQQLLEDLRRLGQREELAGMGAARHEVIPRSLGSCLREHRRLEVDEAVRVEVGAHRAGDRKAQPQPLRHNLAPQVEIAIAQAHFLAHLLVELERQGLRAVQQLELTRHELHASRCEVGVHGARRSLAHPSRHADHELVAQPLGFREDRGRLRIEDDLQQPLAIAQVDENHPAVIAAAMHPAGDRDVPAEERLVDLSAVVRAHRGARWYASPPRHRKAGVRPQTTRAPRPLRARHCAAARGRDSHRRAQSAAPWP